MKSWSGSILICFVGLLPLIVGCGDKRTRKSPASFEDVRSSLADSNRVALAERLDANAADTNIPERIRQAADSFYHHRWYEPIWIDDRSLSWEGRTVLQTICESDDDGLQPEPQSLQRLSQAIDNLHDHASHSAVAEAEVAVATFFFRYIDDLVTGQVAPEQVNAENYLESEEIKLDSILSRAVDRIGLEKFEGRLRPEHMQYDRLQKALASYRELAKDGGWEMVPTLSAAIEPGDTNDIVPALRTRLAVTGELSDRHDDDTSTVYDDRLAGAVAMFQERHGIVVDSIAGPSTIEVMNVPVEKRIQQIELSLERWRWLPADLGDRYVVVNIPAYRVWGYDGNSKEVDMGVVVGAQYGGRQTPVFADVMDHVIFRPYWNVPSTIAAEEVVPHEKENPGYLASRGFEVLQDGQVVSASHVDLEETDTYRVRQKPGDSNALGLVKYMFPNKHSIYLHDTPADHLFAETERAFSHGCIRLEDPASFGVFVLEEQPDRNWTVEDVGKAMTTGDRQVVELDNPIPVYIMHLTAFTDEEGEVQFRNDLYGYDAALESALVREKGSEQAASVCRILAEV